MEALVNSAGVFLMAGFKQPVPSALTFILLILGGGVSLRLLSSLQKRRALTKKRKQKLEQCMRALEGLRASLAKHPVGNESDILALRLPDLLKKLKSGELKPTQVLTAYQAQALKSHDKTNCLVEPIKEAEEWAQQLESVPDKDLPLYGLPVSIKDNLCLQGYDSSVGCSSWIDRPFSVDSNLVRVLKCQGAVPFVKTNVPQTMISWETTNPIYGPSTNKYDQTRGVGGSSGGEGALISCGGSLLGFGSDIGGSIRIPANMNGVCGFKPTAGRVSAKGTHPTLLGQNAVISCLGPLAPDVESLVIGMKAILVPAMWEQDPSVINVPFRDEMFNQKKRLRIGMYTNDGYFHPVPAMERGVMEAKVAIEKLGHEVVPWEYPNIGFTAAKLWATSIFGDGGEELKATLANDATDSAIGRLLMILKAPQFLVKVLSSILKPFMPRMCIPLEGVLAVRTVTDWWNLIAEIERFKQDVMDDWRKQGLDAVICPGFGAPACPIDSASLMSGAASYTLLYNVLNFPAGSLPVTKVTEDDENKMSKYPVHDLWHMVMKKAMVGSTGLPVNVQVVTLPFTDELCLSIMSELEEALKK